jgi:hypothetical protein
MEATTVSATLSRPIRRRQRSRRVGFPSSGALVGANSYSGARHTALKRRSGSQLFGGHGGTTSDGSSHGATRATPGAPHRSTRRLLCRMNRDSARNCGTAPQPRYRIEAEGAAQAGRGSAPATRRKEQRRGRCGVPKPQRRVAWKAEAAASCPAPSSTRRSSLMEVFSRVCVPRVVAVRRSGGRA